MSSRNYQGAGVTVTRWFKPLGVLDVFGGFLDVRLGGMIQSHLSSRCLSRLVYLRLFLQDYQGGVTPCHRP